MCFKRKKRLPERTLNIWNRHDFAMAGLGEKSRIIAMIKHKPLWDCIYLTYSHFFRSKTCPNVTDLNCLISYEFFQKRKMPYKWRKRTNNVKNLQI